MTKEKMISLVRYQSQLKDKLTAQIPYKHVGHPEEYKEFLRRELDAVSKKIDAAKMEGVK